MRTFLEEILGRSASHASHHGRINMKPTSKIVTMFAAAAVPALFSIQSIDTMKDSRDMARTAATVPSYEATIDREMSAIAGTGATHVAIDVPYDEEFMPAMSRWVAAARKHDLRVWFRGNLSGWEGWFDYPQISREDHLKGVERFILAHPDLFSDGDIFSGCPECENGKAEGGDPRRTGDVGSYRTFLINEFQVFSRDFARMGKDVSVISSMNLDVAKLVMDRQTTSALGGVVAIDHYATSTAQFESDIVALHESSGGKVILGEFGGPIPDINGSLNDAQQADLVRGLMDVLHRHADIVMGANYWTLRFGSTALVTDALAHKPALSSVTDYFSAPYISGTVRDDSSDPITKHAFLAAVASSTKTYAFQTDGAGGYRLFVPANSELDRALEGTGGLAGPGSGQVLTIIDPERSYATTTVLNAGTAFRTKTGLEIIMKEVHVGLVERFLRYLGIIK